MPGSAVGPHSLDKPPGRAPILLGGEDEPSPAPGRGEDVETVVVEDDVELLHVAEFVDAPDQLLLRRGQRPTSRLRHARRAVEDVDEAVSLRLEAEDPGANPAR